MDHKGVEYLKIAQILPEFHEGGVERHVLWLSNALAGLGHEVTVISAGGKLEDKLDRRVAFWRLPVQRKNPITGLYSALKIAGRAKRQQWDILHAHSRVPAWIAWWASAMSSKPWIFTAHDRYRKNWAIRPFRRAHGSICVSEAVRKHLSGFLPNRVEVIRNGIPFSGRQWGKKPNGAMRILFVGRLTHRKGLHIVMEALSSLKDWEWSLEVVGDGPQRQVLEALAGSLGIKRRVIFQGFRDDPQKWMVESDLLIFPSLDEGMGLVLMQAIQVGVTVLASDIEPVRELVGEEALLVAPGDVERWRQSIKEVISGEMNPPRFDPKAVPTAKEMAGSVSGFLESVVHSSR
jgi:glycosyltransferase involved in cell wall biosynthesis